MLNPGPAIGHRAPAACSCLGCEVFMRLMPKTIFGEASVVPLLLAAHPAFVSYHLLLRPACFELCSSWMCCFQSGFFIQHQIQPLGKPKLMNHELLPPQCVTRLLRVLTTRCSSSEVGLLRMRMLMLRVNGTFNTTTVSSQVLLWDALFVEHCLAARSGRGEQNS